jgi:hypothetical protein
VLFCMYVGRNSEMDSSRPEFLLIISLQKSKTFRWAKSADGIPRGPRTLQTKPCRWSFLGLGDDDQ